MRDDRGIKWKRYDYLLAFVWIFIILVGISILPLILLGCSVTFGWQYYWEFWAVAIGIIIGVNIILIIKPRRYGDIHGRNRK